MTEAVSFSWTLLSSDFCALRIAECVRPRVIMLDYLTINPWFSTLVWRWFGIGVTAFIEWLLLNVFRPVVVGFAVSLRFPYRRLQS